MEKSKIVNVSGEGHITLSSHAQKQLGLENGTVITEVVVGSCVILMPQNPEVEKVRRRAQDALQKSGVSVDEIIEEVERLKAERFAQEYPDLD